MRLGSRDKAVLTEVFLSRVVRRDDLITLGLFTSVCRCNARLLELKRANLLTVRHDLSGLRLRANIYLSTRRGVRIVAEELGMTQAEALSLFKGSARDLTLRHSLRCTDLRLRLLRDLKAEDSPTLENWSQELLCHHEFIDTVGRSTIVKPDALAILHCKTKLHYVFVEVDLGNASLTKIRDKIDRYRRYANTGAFKEAYCTTGFIVLTVTTDERRLRNIANAVPLQGFLFTTWRRLEKQSLQEKVFSAHDCDLICLDEFLSRGQRV